ncbi:MAG: hypothetical protein CME70_03970 [Halobacteriovorax sp.]|nr:hypothetical protein [Halobacteriovorax sp.]|tara:strand:- start:114946 stop:115842 length:897 start_codon:yes stop_codon:yes gene_type:complete
MQILTKVILLAALFYQVPGLSKSVTLESESNFRKDVKVRLPRGFKKKEKWPLIISMHGYGGSSLIQSYYLRLRKYNNKFGFVYAVPNGLKNKDGKAYWNASNFCCDFDNKNINDVKYIENLIEEISTSKRISRIDPDRIYLMGYSNGAFLASKIACESDLRIAGIVTISGTSDLRDQNGNLLPKDKLNCSHNRPIKVLHIHGDLDSTIRYEGFDNGKTAHVSAIAQTKRWAIHNGCKGDLKKKDYKLNATNFMRGKDTEVYEFSDCAAPVKHFKILKGVHFGIFKKKFTKAMLNFLFL